MSIKALKLTSIRPYISQHDPDRKDPSAATTWLLGTLDSRTSGRIRDLSTRFVVDPSAPDDEVSTVVNTSEVNYQRVQYGLRGFENFKDDDGNDMKFETVKKRHGGIEYDIVADSVMKQIPDIIIAELAEEIISSNELKVDERKNSETPSLQ